VAYSLSGALLQRPYLVTLGGAALALLLVERVRAAARAARLVTGDLRLSWSVALPEGRRAVETGRPFAIRAVLLTDGPALGWATLSAYTSSALEVREPVRVALVPGDAEIRVPLVARAAGDWWVHGGLLVISGTLHLFSVRAFFPAPLRVRALPAGAAVRLGASPVGVEGSGQRRRRLAGPGSDLAEIREAVYGDAYRHVAWKATARTGRLMVRRFQSETPTDHTLCLDLAMNPGAAGKQPLDRAIHELYGYARAALQDGDRVGLVLFSDRVREEIEPGEGSRQLRRLTDALLRARSEPDDATITDGEAIAAAAGYLLWQEGAALRVAPPPLDSTRWEDLLAGPSGDLYDALEMDRRMRGILAREAPAALAAASSPIDRARLLVRARGIETPHRAPPPPDARLRGLQAALDLTGRRHGRIALYTDLPNAALARLPAVRRARQRHGLALHLLRAAA